MDVLYLMLQVSVFTLLTVVYLIFFGGKSRKKTGRYVEPEWNYPLKKWCAKKVVKKWRSDEVQELEISEKTELPRVSAERLWDSLAFHASAPDGTTVELMLRQHQDSTAQVVVRLALPDGTVYRLPDDSPPFWEVIEEKQWSAGGLKFIILEPFHRWRILYNGLLNKEGSDQLIHIRLNFIWSMASAPLRHPEDWNVELAAEALATERWRDERWKRMLERSGAGGGWEQWGSMQGLMRAEDAPELVVRARGVRERWWCPAATEVTQAAAPLVAIQAALQMAPQVVSQVVTPPRLHRAVTLLATAYDGNAVYIRALSHSDPGAPTQAVSGSIRLSNSQVETIEYTDLSLSDFCDSRNELPATYTINVAASRQYQLKLDVESKKKSLRCNGLYGLDTVCVPVQVNINGNPGYGWLQLGYEPVNKLEELQTKPAKVDYLRWTVEESLPDVERARYCAHFTRPAAACPQLVGAKGASLALLTSRATNGYSVPPGFCLTTHAMERHIARHPHLQEAVRDIIRVNENYDEAALKEKCARTVKLFTETPVEGEVRSEIVAHLAELRQDVLNSKLVDDITFAVRSSAVGEDSEELSAAGQNDTVLGCRSEEQVLTGVQRCWASLYSFHSTQYRRMHGQKADTGMGVVVQSVIPARAAGVLFSRHPNTGHPNRILLTANYGLGESVVSGQVEPDTFILERLHSDVRILTSEIGKKSHRVVLSAAGETEQLALSGSESGTCCLSEEECRRLGRLAVEQERLWGAPRDLEWAIYKDDIYLVQARPITSLERWTEFELKHEFDTPVMSEEDYFSFANTGEVLPGALTPLTVSTICLALERASYQAVNRKAMPQFTSDSPFFQSHYHFGLSMYNTMMRRMSKQVDVGVRVLEMAVHGHEVADARTHAIALKRNPPQLFERVLMMVFMIEVLFGSKKALDKTKRLVDSYHIDQLEVSEPRSMLKEIEDSLETIRENMLQHNISTSGSVFSQVVAMSILMEGADKFSLDHLTDISLMLSSCSDVISADVPLALSDIAHGVAASGKNREFGALPPGDCLAWLKDNCPDVYDRTQQFLQDHAHRNIKEFDLATKTWGLDPTSLLQSIQSAVKAQAAQPERKENKVIKTNREIAASVVSPKKSITRWLLRLVLPLCQRTVSHREGTKAYNILAIHRLRLAFLKLAARMQEEWLLPDQYLVFYFTLDELRTYISTRDPALIKKASQRRQYFSAWNALKFPEMNEGHLEPLVMRDPRLALAGAAGAAKLKGTPVYPGDVIGRACVITDLAQIGQLQRGDILITHSTDIGWSPYFPLLGGVVTELGGLISHGAVIAREYGLPCMVGAEGATAFCRTGDLVLLAGATGVLEKIDPATPTPQPQPSPHPPVFPPPVLY